MSLKFVSRVFQIAIHVLVQIDLHLLLDALLALGFKSLTGGADPPNRRLSELYLRAR